MKINYSRIFLLLVFVLGFFLRFNLLTSIPPGLGRDEVSVAYNAYSILKTGRDEHNRYLPLYFEAIGDQKLPVIIYLTVPSVALFGLTPLGTRFPEALLGSLTVVLSYFLVKQGLRSEKIKNLKALPYLTPLLIAINPWHIYHSRGAFEICIGLFFITTATYSLLKAVTQKWWYFVSLTLFIIAFYTYSMTRLLVPIILIYYLAVNRKQIIALPKKFILGLIGLGFILLLPFIINFFDPGGIFGPKGAVILSSSYTKSVFLGFRSYVLNSPVSFLGPIFFNRIIMVFYEYLKNILTALSPGFYFANGSAVAGIGNIGQFYLVEIVPFIIGIVTAYRQIRAGNRFYKMIVGWIILTVLSASWTVNPPYATRTFFIIVPTIIIIATGWITIMQFLVRKKVRVILSLTVISAIYLWQVSFYLVSYYFRFPIVYANEWEARASELFDYLKENEGEADKIVITKPEKSMYAFLLFYHQIPPQEVWTKLERYPTDPDGWHHGKKFGKYEFREIDWNKDNTEETNAILVSEGGEYPEHQVVTKELFYPTKYTVFPLGQQILAMPETTKAYRIWRVIPLVKPAETNN